MTASWSTSSSAIVIRTHYVDEELLSLAARLSEKSDYLVVFAVDERDKVIPTQEFAKVSISYDVFSRLRLPLRNQNEIWKCGDYILYAVLDRFPQLDYIWLLENDAYVNRTDPLSFFQDLDKRSRHDFLATYVEVASPEWFWHKTMSGKHSEVHKCFFPLVRVSAQAIRHLLSQRRLDEETTPAEDHDRIIPNDEAFTATELVTGGFSVVDLNEMGDYYTPRSFNYHDLFHPKDLKPEDGILYHPVRSGSRYLQRALPRAANNREALLTLLAKMTVEELLEGQDHLRNTLRQELSNLGDNPGRILKRDSVFQEILVRFPHVPIVRMIALVLGEARMPFCLKALKQYTSFIGLDVDVLENLALGRPAWQSSTCQWSLRSGCRADAEGANNGDQDAPNGFHTDLEVEPWWTVDLLDVVGIRSVRIFNRPDFEDRMKSFQVLGSMDGLTWRQLYQHPPEQEITRVVEVNFSDLQSVSARYLRVQLPGLSQLHFSEIEVY